MQIRSNIGCSLVLAFFVLSMLVPAWAQGQQLKGTITLSGAWALYPMVVKWGEEFQKLYPQVRVDISAGGAGKGAADALAGAVDIGMVSRAISPEEMKKGGWFVPVVKDAVVPTVSEKNPALKELLQRGIRKKAFLDIFMNGTLTSWGDLVANKGIKSDIHLYTRSDACGAAESWANYLGGKQENLKGIAVYGDPGLLEAVKRDPLALGYNNYNYAFDSKTGLPVAGTRVVPIDVNGNSRVDPEEDISTKAKMREAIIKGVYPHPPARPLNFLCKGKPGGLTREFILWVLTDGQQYVDEVGYIQLPKARIDEALQKTR